MSTQPHVAYKMATVTTRDEYRIIVRPSLHGYALPSDPDARHKAVLMIAREVDAAIKRHVDGVESRSLVYDVHVLCAHCGYKADDAMDEETGGPACCQQAIDEFEEWKK